MNLNTTGVRITFKYRCIQVPRSTHVMSYFLQNTDTQKQDADEKNFAEIAEIDDHISDKTNKCSN